MVDFFRTELRDGANGKPYQPQEDLSSIFTEQAGNFSFGDCEVKFRFVSAVGLAGLLRLSAVMRDIWKFYGSEMERLGFGFRTFTLDEAADGLLNIHVVTGAKLMPTMMCRAGMKSGRNVCRF